MNTPESFWNFSVRTYRCKGIPQACLTLQTERGADVNVLLFCCWMGVTRGEFDAATFEAVLTFSHSWTERVVRPLRGARTWMKTTGCPDPLLPERDCMDLRERIKAVEFEAERLQENVMQTLVDDIPQASLNAAGQLDAAVRNLRRYCVQEGIDWDRETQMHLEVILRAAIPGGANPQLA